MKKLSLILFSISILLIIQNLSYSEGKKIFGKAQVIDGDTIKINGEKIRLFGIDAFELQQTCIHKEYGKIKCGQGAKIILESIVESKITHCFYSERDRYGRILGTCFIETNNDKFQYMYDINRWMVLLGQAVAYRRYSKKYIEAENLGMYSEYINPEEWRKKNK